MTSMQAATKPVAKKSVPSWAKDFEVVFGEDKEKEIPSEFALALQESSAKNFMEGEVFKGEVISINDDYVMVDIGYKQEGLVSAKELKNFDGTIKVKVGDKIEVYLERLESNLGNLILSRDKAEILKAWDKISEACDSGEPLEGTVVQKVKGGLSVDIGVKAFLPGSQIDIRPTRNLDKFIGKTMKFKVIKFNKKRGNIVLSRRAILAEERTRLRGETLQQIEEGMIVRGIVKNITDYGAFIDLGGLDGLLHITDMSWGRVKHPGQLLTVGEEIEVKVLKFDSDKERVSLGLKQAQANPWEMVEEKFTLGKKVMGEVVSIKDYGAFVDLGEGIEGLIHVSEMSWSQKPKHPSKYVNIGDQVESVVLEVDTENKRISLGQKQLMPNPWTNILEKYKLGQKIQGTIKSVVDFGLFIDIGEEVDALIHVSDISWTRKNINPKNEFKENDTIEAIVIQLDSENQKFCLGLKQLEEDPWKRIEQRFPVGALVETQVVRLTDFGVFVELETGIEGLIHISELSEERVAKPSDVVKKGDIIKAMVISVDKDAKKIALSVKASSTADQKQTIKAYKTEELKVSTLGDKLKNFQV